MGLLISMCLVVHYIVLLPSTYMVLLIGIFIGLLIGMCVVVLYIVLLTV